MSLLRRFEGERVSGRLHFEGAGVSGEVWLVGGQPLDDEAQLEAMERLLQLEAGEFHFTPALPPLPMSRGDDRVREGRLGVHAVADLMAYCEDAGLTGTLSVRRREREARLGYFRGELVDIRVDGQAHDDLMAIFEWEAGDFRIELTETSPAEENWAIRSEELRAEAPPLAVEVSLEQIVEEGRNRRPSNLPPPKVRASERKPRPDATVKIVFLGAPEPVTAPEVELALAPPKLPLDTYDDEKPEGFVSRAGATLGWIAVWAALVLAALASIPHMPLDP